MIAQTVTRLGAITTSQVTKAFFKGPSAQRMAQARLLALYRARRLDRRAQHGRDNVWVPWRSRSGDLQHRLAIAQAWLDTGMPSDFEREYAIGPVRADALFWIGRVPMFLEVERSHNAIARKMEGYMALWRERKAWRDRFGEEFPHILIVVPSEVYVERALALPSPPKTVCTPSGVARAVSSAFTVAKSSGGAP